MMQADSLHIAGQCDGSSCNHAGNADLASELGALRSRCCCEMLLLNCYKLCVKQQRLAKFTTGASSLAVTDGLRG